MDRRAPALVALLSFAVATVLATVLDGRLPAGEESVAGWVLQVLGYLAAADSGGADIGLGGVRLIGLLAVGAVALRLAPVVARERRGPSGAAP